MPPMIVVAEHHDASIKVLREDLDEASCRHFMECRRLVVDTETSGLDPLTESLDLVQISDGLETTVFVRSPQHSAPNLRRLFRSSTEFVFHFARFDLAFLIRHVGVAPRDVVCTKVAARLLRELPPEASFQSLVAEVLKKNVEKDPAVRTSRWNTDSLSAEQVRYAFEDVHYLLPLWIELEQRLAASQRLETAREYFRCIPTLAEADAHGLPRLFQYK